MLARALYDNTADFADELTFHRGDVLVVIERELSGAPGWWLCSLNGRQGIAAANRLQLISVKDQDELNNSNSSNNSISFKNRGYFYQPLTTANADEQRRGQEQQVCYLASPVSSTNSLLAISPSSVPPPPSYSESDPASGGENHSENIYENFTTSAESENLYEDPAVWENNRSNNATPTMLKQSRQTYTVRTVATGSTPTPSTSTLTRLSPEGGLLVTTTAQHRVNHPPGDTYQAGSTDSGVYSASNRDYAEDIYDYPAAFQQMQQKFEKFAVTMPQDGVYDMLPASIGNDQMVMADYDFVQMSPRQQLSPNQQQIGDYDALPVRIPVEISMAPIGEQQAPSESMETLPEFSQAECEKAFENRRNVIERLVRYEHAVTRAATRWTRLFGSSGWRKSNFLISNSYAIRNCGEQLSQTMTTFAAFAAAALQRLDFPTFASVANLRQAYEPLYIEATNFKKYLNSVGLVNWTLENATPHLTKTFEVMLHSQRTFLTNLAVFSNILKRADFSTISSTIGSTHNLSTIEQQSTLTKQPQHRTFMVVKDVQTPTQLTPPVPVIVDETPATPKQAQRGVSTVHINISNPESSPNKSTSSNIVNIAVNSNRPKSLRFAEDVELVNQVAGDLEQRIGELSFVVSTFVLSLRRTQPSTNKPDLPDGQRYNGGFIECGKLLVNVAHSVVLIGDKLSTIVTEPDRSESIKTSTDRLRVCIRVFVEKLKNVASAGSRSTSAVDDLITHVEVLRSQAETIKHRLDSPPHQQQSLSTPTATLNR